MCMASYGLLSDRISPSRILGFIVRQVEVPLQLTARAAFAFVDPYNHELKFNPC